MAASIAPQSAEFLMEKADSFIEYVRARGKRPVLCFYLHPWEFHPMPQGALDFGESSVKPLPFIVKNCGPKAVKQLDRVCTMLKERGGRFVTAKELAAEYCLANGMQSWNNSSASCCFRWAASPRPASTSPPTRSRNGPGKPTGSRLGFVAWIIMPTVGGLLTTPDLWGILRASSPVSSMAWSYVFGALWGFGGLMCGLALRYLGLSLGQSISLGVCAIVGTLVPAILDNKIGLLVSTLPGGVVLLGFLVCLAGIALCGYAGVLKERLLTDDQKKESIKDFALVKGLTVAVFGGIMSASMALAFTAGKPIAARSRQAPARAEVFKNMPLLVLALAGGFTTNFISTMIITAKKQAFGDYVLRPRGTLFLQLFPGRHQRTDVVRAILLLRHGHHEDGRVQLRQLEHLHGRRSSSSAISGDCC